MGLILRLRAILQNWTRSGALALGSAKDAAFRVTRKSTEAYLLTSVGLSLAIGAKVGLAVTSSPNAITTLLSLLGGWLAADFVGAVYHWTKDNYPKGRNGFLDHHRDPKAVARWPLRTNAEGTALPVTLLLAGTAILEGGPLPAFFLTLLNGILLTEHVHGYSHADEADIPPPIRMLQSIPGLPILLPPAKHLRHHAQPLGKEAYGGLNGWSNYITDTTRFFRLLEIGRQALTGEKPGWQEETPRSGSERRSV